MDLVLYLWGGDPREIPYEPRPLNEARDEHPDALVLDMDANSDSAYVQRIGEVVAESEEILVILDTPGKPVANAGAMRSMMEILMKHRSRVRVREFGQHPMLGKIAAKLRKEGDSN